MKTKDAIGSSLGTFQSIGGLAIAVAVACWPGVLICAQDLFATHRTDIYKFSPEGVRSTFASGLGDSRNFLAFNSHGELFIGDGENGNIYEYTRSGVRSTFASNIYNTFGLVFDSTDNLFVSQTSSGNIYKFNSNGQRSLFALGLDHPGTLAIDSSGDVFVNQYPSYGVYKFTKDGIFTSFLPVSKSSSSVSLAFDKTGNLFVGNDEFVMSHDLEGNPFSTPSGSIYELDPSGIVTVFVSKPGADYQTNTSWLKYAPSSLAFDSGGSLFVTSENIYRYTPDGKRQIFAEGSYDSIAFQSPIPEPPVTAMLLITGLIGVLVRGWRRVS
jgi:sugar lactone lactonase YvrE